MRGKKGNLLLTELVDINRWQLIQDYFSEVIGTGLRTLDLEGKSITKPSRTPRFCSEVVAGSPLGLKRCRNCRPMPIYGLETGSSSFSFPCPAGPQNFVVPIIYNGLKVAAHIIVGPVIFGKREELDKSEETARNLGISKEDLEDALREIKTFTFRGIQLAVGLLGEVSSYICRLSYEKFEMGESALESSFMTSAVDESLTKVDLPRDGETIDGLLQVLLDVALNTMGAEMGSIMLLDQETGELFVKTAKGLDKEIIKNVRMKVGEGIAGLVARDKRALLLDEEVKDPEVRSLLKRPEIQSALVAPLKIDDELIGILTVGTVHPSDRFTQDNLNLIAHLANKTGEVACHKL
ncbi:MAG: GAF domain-containing protein [Nitrospirae bacterium]|nr:GAF domain-containing protein [Nitrospirota bacterium]